MSSPFSELHAAVASHSAFAESCTHVRAAAVDTTVAAVNVRVRRQQAREDRRADGLWRCFPIQILVPRASVAAEPARGDVWNVEKCRGDGSPVAYTVELVEAGDGVWILTAVREEQFEGGGGEFDEEGTA